MRQHVYLYRSAITGKFVSAAYAKRHPKTTIRQRVKYANPAY
jgi:hypothetical protein